MRVIAGRFGGRRLIAPEGAQTRPTADRVREALFSILGNSVEGARVLDLYAGTGALGIEALSRGAVFAMFVEQARGAFSALQENLRSLELSAESFALKQSVERSFPQISRRAPFDVVFADPPYAGLRQAAFVVGSLLSIEGMLKASGQLVLEHAGRDRAPEVVRMKNVETRSYGEAALSFYVPESV